MNPNQIAVIADYPRLAKRYDVWRKLYRVTHDSFPALFRTKEHKRRVIRRDKAAQRFQAEVRKQFGIRKWDVRKFHQSRWDDPINTVIVWDDNDQ